MKFIKKYKLFESQDCFTQFDVDEICSLFRDFVDEFEIERYTDDESDNNNDNDYFTYRLKACVIAFEGHNELRCITSDSVQFNNIDNIKRLEFIVFFPIDCEYHIKEEDILSSLDSCINRISEMGHHVNKEIEYVDESIESVDKIDEDIDNITIKITI